MNLSTIIISILLIALFSLAVRYLIKNGTCSGCSEKNSCHSTCSGSCKGSNCSCCRTAGGMEKQ